MELAKVTSKGQVTIPVEIRKKLHLKPGDKILFVEQEQGVTMLNSSTVALQTIQSAMEGEAESAGVKDDQDVVDLIRKVRNTERGNSSP